MAGGFVHDRVYFVGNVSVRKGKETRTEFMVWASVAGGGKTLFFANNSTL